MPFNRFSYNQLTAQINVLSFLGAALYEIQEPDQETKVAIARISGRIRTEIDRLARHRKKDKRSQIDEAINERSPIGETQHHPDELV